MFSRTTTHSFQIITLAIFASQQYITTIQGFSSCKTITNTKQRSYCKMSSLHMYTVNDKNDPAITIPTSINNNIFSPANKKTTTIPNSINKFIATNYIEQTHGMPWQQSIQSTSPLIYMPFWEWQLAYMQNNLSNLHPIPVTPHGSTSFPHLSTDLSYNENTVKGARIANRCYASDDYRKIRMTYYDAGKACQVYNSLWYPRDGSLPVLGVDLLSFNGRKHLSVVDYQPTWERQEDDDDDDDASSSSAFDYETMVLKPIREKYPSLQGRMSQRFYDESRFFSRHMLFGRYEDVSIVEREVMPAFMESVTEYVADRKSVV